MTAKATFRIEGEDATALAFRSALGNAQGAATHMQGIFRTAFRDIAGAAGPVANVLGAGGVGRSLGAIKTLLGAGGIAGGLGLVTLGAGSLVDKIKEWRDQQEHIKDLADRLELPVEQVRRYSEAWAGVAENMRDVARGFGELNGAQANAFSALGASPFKAGIQDELKSRVAAASGSRADKIDVMRILFGMSEEQAGKELDAELKRLNEKIFATMEDFQRGIGKTRAEAAGLVFGAEDIGALRRTGQISTGQELKELEALGSAVAKFQEEGEKLRNRALENQKKAAEEQQKLHDKVWADWNSHMEAQRQQWADIEELTMTSSEKQAKRIESFWAALDQQLIDGLPFETYTARAIEGLDAIDGGLGEIEVTAKRVGSSFSEAFDDAAFEEVRSRVQGVRDSMEDALTGFVAHGKLKVHNLVDYIIEEFARLRVVRPLLDSLFSGGGSGGLGGFLGSVFGGFKAGGGPLEQGKWYVAGEKGPEPIWGGGPGAFAMGYGRGGRGDVHIRMGNTTIDARGSTLDSVKRLEQMLPGILKNHQRETVHLSVAAVHDQMDRRGRGWYR